jgi:hypothetical protein
MSTAADPAPGVTYSEDIPEYVGFWVYRLWAPERCLYAGMVGNLGPRTVQSRLRRHAQTKPWWPEVTRIDVAECDDRRHAFREERHQLETLKPVHNGPKYWERKVRKERQRALAPLPPWARAEIVEHPIFGHHVVLKQARGAVREGP